MAVGRVLRPHGVKGEVVVQALSDVPGRLERGSRLLAVRDGSPPPQAQLEIETSRPHKAGAVVRFLGFADRDRAEELRDVGLEVRRSDVPTAPRGTYYHFQLLGCSCREGERELGRVVDLIEDGGGLLLVVSDGERQVPVPFVKRFLRRVDVEAGTIDLTLPAGLLETCASRS
ncbi:MAG TPA: ribosome maturation factor RimM [Thermoanaerobaculia bacterium]